MKGYIPGRTIVALLLSFIMISCIRSGNTLKTEYTLGKETGIDAIVEGIHSLGSLQSIPGPIIPGYEWTIVAFCPYYQIHGVQKEPGIFAAARIFGNGRVFAMGHEGYFGTDLDFADNKQFGLNVIRWLDISGKKRICVRRTMWSSGIEQGLVNELNKLEYLIHYVEKDDELTEEDLSVCDVLVYTTRWQPITDKEIDVIISFINNGGGALLTGLGWSFTSYVNEDIREFPMNKIAIRTGLFFEAGTLLDPEYNYDNKPEHPVIRRLYPESPKIPGEEKNNKNR